MGTTRRKAGAPPCCAPCRPCPESSAAARRFQAYVDEGRIERLTVENTGTGELDIGHITTSGGPFTLQANACGNRSIPPGGRCTLEVVFAPMEAGSYEDELNFPINTPEVNPKTVELIGTGVAPGFSANPDPGIALLASRAPALVIRSRAVRRGPKGGVRVRVTCRAPRDRRCHGRLELGGGGRQDASRRLTVRGGRGAGVRVRLPRAACRKAGAAGRIRVRARTTTTIPVGLATRRGRALTVTC